MGQIIFLGFTDGSKVRCHHDEVTNRHLPVTFDPFQYLLQWSPSSVWIPPTELDMCWIHNCAWGSELADATIRYLQDCRWPDVDVSNSHNRVGITWLEIAAGIMHYLGEYIPVRCLDSTGTLHLIRLRNYEDAQLHSATLSEMGENVSRMLVQLVALTPKQLYPNTPRTTVQSMYFLGETHFGQGFQLRPKTANIKKKLLLLPANSTYGWNEDCLTWVFMGLPLVFIRQNGKFDKTRQRRR